MQAASKRAMRAFLPSKKWLLSADILAVSEANSLFYLK